ncbi:MAG: MogA/MoaB family molybdenum cofactor biosynthesis protein [Aigarchaeota archaeon]|nr:MogA/MoaB family molybdenum cofactor biosynthesis protein [Aigarchaeota archaeon]MDW8092969.1 MogA/MoaB family molybdenum cofactor biosynthesis protein [Nitrososphaerota archaeon]
MSKPPAHEEHKAHAPKHLKIAVITASSSRYRKKVLGEPFTDEAGDIAVKSLRERGHEVRYVGVLDDDIKMLREALLSTLSSRDIDVVMIIGGTGLTKRDVTVEAIRPFFEKEIEGFGEIFRVESYKRIGPSAALTRSTAGVVDGRLVILLPGSPDAVKTAIDVFADELPHAVHLTKRP